MRKVTENKVVTAATTTAILGLNGEKYGGGWFSGDGEIWRELVKDEDSKKMMKKKNGECFFMV